MEIFHRKPQWTGKEVTQEQEQIAFRKQWVDRLAFPFGFFLLALGLIKRNPLSLLLSLLLLLALFSRHYSACTEVGVESFSNMFFSTNHRLWPWEEIRALTYEKVPGHPDYHYFYFTRGDVTRRRVFPSASRKAILALAKEKNPKIAIFDGKDYREGAMERLQERARERRQEKKRGKRG